MNPSNDTSRDPARNAGPADVAMTTGDTGTDAGPPMTGDSAGDLNAPTPAQESQSGTTTAAPAEAPTRGVTRTGAAWAAVVAALLLAVVLIVFVLQNPTPVVIHFLGWSGSVAVGMAMLIAAVTGGLLVATIGVARLTQLRVRAHRTKAKPVRA